MGTLDRIRAKKNMIRAVAYARFSSDNQRDESVDAQIRAMQEYARKNDIIIVGEYIDRAKSAKTDNRPQFLQMISDSKQDTFDLVLVHKLDRFARNRGDSIGYRMALKKNDVVLVSVLEFMDEDSPESIILESVLEAMAEYYSKNLAREVQKGMHENALKGMHTGGIPPLGYDVDLTTRLLVINEKEAESIRLIFKMHSEGSGYKVIAKELDLKGYRNKKNEPIPTTSIRAILQNEKYSGVYVFNKSVAKDMDGRRIGGSKELSEIVKVQGIVPPIVSKEIFELAAKKFKKNATKKATNKAVEVYLLSGKLFCGECGGSYAGNRKYSGRNKTLHVTYRCTTKQLKRTCENKEIRREYIETFALEMLANYIFDESLIPDIAAEYKTYMITRNADAIGIKENIEKQIKQITKEIDNLVTVVSQTASVALADKIPELETKKAILEFRLNDYSLVTDSIGISEDDLRVSFQQARNLLQAGELKSAKKLVDMYINKVLLFKGHTEIFFNFHPRLTIYKDFEMEVEKSDNHSKNNNYHDDFILEDASENASKPSNHAGLIPITVQSQHVCMERVSAHLHRKKVA